MEQCRSVSLPGHRPDRLGTGGLMTRSRITGLGMCVPERVVTNADLEKLMDTSDAWIVERTGIHERRFAAPGQGTTDLAAEASRRALADAGRTVADVDFIVFA